MAEKNPKIEAEAPRNTLRGIGQQIFANKTVQRFGPMIFMMGMAAAYYKSKSNGEEEEIVNPFGMNASNNCKSRNTIKIERLNDKIDDYTLTVIGASRSKSEMAALKKSITNSKLVGDLFGKKIADLSPLQVNELLKAEKEFHASIAACTSVEGNILSGIRHLDRAEQNFQANIQLAESSLAGLGKTRLQAELLFMDRIKSNLTPSQQIQLNQSLTAPSSFDFKSLVTRQPSALDHMHKDSFMFRHATIDNRPHVYVIKFDGDIMASQVSSLREEITAVVTTAQPSRGDRVVLLLNSGGGTVTGYGLAASQLQRVKTAGLSLTVCVDQVAASGGYLMAAVADKIIASPFAVLGSIGVVATMPNFANRLEREGIVVEDVTAGQYKRTMTPYKKSTDSDRAKMQADINDVLSVFKNALKISRPTLNVEAVATGETWHGPDALQRGLCDELGMSDDYLLALKSEGAEIFSIQHSMRRTGLSGFLNPGAGASDFSSSSWMQQLIRYAVQEFVSAVGLNSSSPSMAIEDLAMWTPTQASPKSMSSNQSPQLK